MNLSQKFTKQSYILAWPIRTISAVLVPIYLVTAMPLSVLAAELAGSASRIEPPANVAKPVLTPKNVKANKKQPKYVRASKELKFSEFPKDKEIRQARVLADGLVPSFKSDSRQNKALAGALLTYQERTARDDWQSLSKFIKDNPNSSWNLSLELNLGIQAYQTGHFSKALELWESAWKRGQSAKDPATKAQADQAFGELVRMHARIGNMDRLKELFKEAGSRSFTGSATELVANSRAGLWMMEHQPEISFRCGPMALASIVQSKDRAKPFPQAVVDSASTPKGFSLQEVKELSDKLKLNYQMAQWQDRVNSVPPVPSVIHWKVGHYAALVREENGLWLVRDPTFGQDLWLTKAALADEASGYFLIPNGELPKGWTTVTKRDAGEIFGKGNTGNSDGNGTTPDAPEPPPPCPEPPDPDSHNPGWDYYFNSGKMPQPRMFAGESSSFNSKQTEQPTMPGMAYSNAHLMLVSLLIRDTPIFYTPPKGPGIAFKLTYNQREANQPSIFNYSNLGPKWTFNWLSFITDDPSATSSDVKMYTKGGGAYVFRNFNVTTQSFDRESYSRGTLVRTGTDSYENTFPDGSKQVFDLSDGGTGAGRRVFMTSESDPSGNMVAYGYDGQFRLVSVTDSLGQVTTIEYNHPTDDLKITKITDPFSREVTLEYNENGRLSKITDVVGITSEFTYGTNDFITALITPYGTETYAYGESGTTRWLDLVDAQGDKRRVEFRHDAPGIAGSDPSAAVPSGQGLTNAYLNYRNVFYWDKKAWKLYPGDYTKAEIIHFLHSAGDPNTVTSVIESTKKPFENRVWYLYPGQSNSYFEGSSSQPIKIVRNLNAAADSEVTQLIQVSYNTQGNVLEKIDPLGRTTSYGYDTNGIDLLEVHQTTGAMDDLLASATYNGQHLPLTVTDAAGQTTTFTYNGSGQVETVTNSKSETTTMDYDGDGYLQSIDGPASGSGDSSFFTYDGSGRPETVTDSEGYVLTYDYDALNRVTKVTYPDTTYNQVIYNKLDAEWIRDREGRWMHNIYNPVRQKIAQQDTLGRTLYFEWCKCGALQGLTDAMGRTTKWKYDVQGRLLEKTYPDNTKLSYTYEEATSRLKSMVDAKDQRTNYEYFLDNQLKQVTYTDLSGSPLSPATDGVAFTYDDDYGRLETMVDGMGTTTYAYNAITSSPTLGAGQLVSIDGPLANDTVTYDYDELGRTTGRAINSVSQTQSYDALGRVDGVVNPLGTFVYNYVNYTGRLSSIELPNGQRTEFSYFNNAGDQRLEEIKNLDAQSTPAIISKFNYTYSPSGNILTWRQENSGIPSAPKIYNFRYDLTDQLVGATFKNATTSAILKESVYRYDRAGNRTSEQTDLAVTSSTNNNLNQVTSTTGGGPLEFSGTVSEPSAVTVGGNSAQIDASGNFRGTATVNSGTSTVAVVATDASSNVTTQNYSVTVPSSASHTLTYDLNGNITDNGTGQTYEWDAANRLVKINYSTGGSTEFTYDGLGRRTKIVEKDAAPSVISDKRFVWLGLKIAEERDSSNTVIKRFYGQGVQVPAAGSPGNKLFYIRDHLGTIREVTDNDAVVRGRWDYDSYGKRTANLVSSGALEVDFSYTSHYWHSRSILTLAPFRTYDPSLGKWLSRDPIAEQGGINLYAYVGNNPVNFWDPFGLQNAKPGKTPPKSWPTPPESVVGKKPKWNPEGHWDGIRGPATWDDRSHGSGQDRGQGAQGGHWDASGRRWGEDGTLLPCENVIPWSLPAVSPPSPNEVGMMGLVIIGIGVGVSWVLGW